MNYTSDMLVDRKTVECNTILVT